MSEPSLVTLRKIARNCATSLRSGRMVRRVHDKTPVLYVVIIGALLGAACVIPPSLSVDTGSNTPPDSPPAITGISADQEALNEFGTVSFGVGQDSTAIVSLVDTDVGDTLFIRWFVDYSAKMELPPRVNCSAGSGMVERSASCSLVTLCTPADVGTDHALEVAVFDRPLLDGSGTPEFQFMGSDGLTTNQIFTLQCEQ